MSARARSTLASPAVIRRRHAPTHRGRRWRDGTHRRRAGRSAARPLRARYGARGRPRSSCAIVKPNAGSTRAFPSAGSGASCEKGMTSVRPSSVSTVPDARRRAQGCVRTPRAPDRVEHGPRRDRLASLPDRMCAGRRTSARSRVPPDDWHPAPRGTRRSRASVRSRRPARTHSDPRSRPTPVDGPWWRRAGARRTPARAPDRSAGRRPSVADAQAALDAIPVGIAQLPEPAVLKERQDRQQDQHSRRRARSGRRGASGCGARPGVYHRPESQKFLEYGLFTGLTMTLPALNDLGRGGEL